MQLCYERPYITLLNMLHNNVNHKWFINFTAWLYTVDSEIFIKNFIFANGIKRHISDVKNSRQRQDLPKSINDRVIFAILRGFYFHETSRKFLNLQYHSQMQRHVISNHTIWLFCMENKYVYVSKDWKRATYEGCSNMNASSFINLVTYMLRQNGIRFYKELYVTFQLAPDLNKNTVY